MTDRPRLVYIGVPTRFRIKGFKNKETGALLTGIATGTLKLYDDSSSAQVLLATINFVEDTQVGDYSAIVPAAQAGLVDGAPGRFIIEISGGSGFETRVTGRCNYRSFTDDGL